MTKFLAYVIIALLAAVGFLVAFVLHLRSELKLTKCQLATCEKEKQGFAEQVQRLTSAAEITSGNRKEADEKVDELHAGDAVSNALDSLRKPKG